MTGKKADYPRSKSQLEIQEKGRVCGVWKLGIDDNYADTETDDPWLALRFVKTLNDNFLNHCPVPPPANFQIFYAGG